MTIKALKETCSLLGVKLQIATFVDGTKEYVIKQNGVPVFSEIDQHDLAESLQAYFGGHENWPDAYAELTANSLL